MARILRVMAFLVLVAGAAGCSQSPSASPDVTADATATPMELIESGSVTTLGDDAPPGDPIVVGVILDDDNVLAPVDHQAHVGFGAAVALLNERGGVLGRPVEVLSESSESRMSVVDAAARRMLDAGVDLLVVTCEYDFARPALDRAEEAGVLVLSPCAGESQWETGEAGDLAFSLVSGRAGYGARAADLVWSEGSTTASVLIEDRAPDAETECSGFADRFEELGGDILLDKALPFLDAVEALAEQPGALDSLAESDVIYLCAYQRIGTLALSTIRDEEILTPVLGGLSMDNSTFRTVDVDGLGAYRMLSYASASGDDPAPEVAAVIDAYRRVDGISPASGRFVLGADTAFVWAAAVADAGTLDGRALAATLASGASFDVASGELTFAGGHAASGRSLRLLDHRDNAMVFDRLLPDPGQ